MKKLLLYAFVFCIPFIGFAQGENNEQSSNWEWNITPSLWLTGVKGSVGIDNLNGSDNYLTSDYTDANSKKASSGLLKVEASKGRWGIMLEAFYLNQNKTGKLFTDFEGIDLGRVAKTSIENTVVELGGSYSFIKLNTLNLDFIFGARYLDGKTVVKSDGSHFIGDAEFNFVDPYVGLRFKNYFNKLAIAGRFDVGGFGVGSSISYKYNITASYNFTDLLSLEAGYQSFGPNYNEDDVMYEITTEGFIFGLGFTF